MASVTAKLSPLLSNLCQVAPSQLPSLRLISKRQSHVREDRIPPLLPRLVIPVSDKTEDAVVYNRYFAQGQFLSRQENWCELGGLIRTFDAQRTLTPGGHPVAEVLAAGARHDAVVSATEAVARYDEVDAQAPIEALQEVFEEHCADHGVALVVARAHIEVAWAWRGNSWGYELPVLNKGAFHAHSRAAAKILDRFDAFEHDAPSIAAARCALLGSDQNPEQRVADDYEDLIDLDPHTPQRMRDMGVHLLPQWFGSYEKLDAGARRVMENTQDCWEAGGYTWAYMDALAVDPKAFETMDAPLFIAGMRDILERQPDQHTANLFASYMAQYAASYAINEETETFVTHCFDWLIKGHLQEIHPLLWTPLDDKSNVIGPMPVGRTNQKQGRVRAISALAQHFSDQIRAGNRVLIDAGGVTLVPAE